LKLSIEYLLIKKITPVYAFMERRKKIQELRDMVEEQALSSAGEKILDWCL